MKQLVFIVMMACALSTNAQDFKKVTSAFILGKKEEAKVEIDKVMNDPKASAKPEAWFWKATVYGSLYADEQLSLVHPYAGETAFAAFRKYSELDPSFKVMNESSYPGKLVIDNLYTTNLRKGISSFDKKAWDTAYRYFSLSAEIGELITKNNWKNNNQPIDTTTVLFTAYAAHNAKKMEDAAKYYSRLADLKLKSAAASENMQDVYEFLLQYYLQSKNTPQFNKYLALSREVFPKAKDLWADFEMEYSDKNLSIQEIAQAFDKADAAGTLTANQYLSYGNIFYNIKDEEKEKMDSLTLLSYRSKAETAFIKGYEKDNLNGLSAYNAGLVNYNQWADLDDEVNANRRKIRELNQSKSTIKDPKQKAAADAKIKAEVASLQKRNADLEKIQHQYASNGIEWTEKAYNTFHGKENLDRIEKSVYSKTVDYLANLYQWKRDQSKGNNADYDKYDALYKKYDALHGKL